jgi:hypothetical protein
MYSWGEKPMFFILDVFYTTNSWHYLSCYKNVGISLETFWDSPLTFWWADIAQTIRTSVPGRARDLCSGLWPHVGTLRSCNHATRGTFQRLGDSNVNAVGTWNVVITALCFTASLVVDSKSRRKEAAFSSETSVFIYKTTRHYSPQNRTLNTAKYFHQCGWSLERYETLA